MYVAKPRGFLDHESESPVQVWGCKGRGEAAASNLQRKGRASAVGQMVVDLVVTFTVSVTLVKLRDLDL